MMPGGSSAAWTKAEKTIMTAMAPPKELVLAKTKTKAPREQNGLDKMIRPRIPFWRSPSPK
jgi:hypothetical protein